jgi:hypothetical protein
MWYGMIRGVAGEIFRRERTSTPPASSSSISLRSAAGEHDAVADQAQRVVAQDARRDQVQHGLLAVNDQRVAGVVTALETHDRADVLREQVDDLALAFVAPLGAQNHYRLTHCLLLRTN